MNHDEKWFELADVYALGALDKEERAEFETHLFAGCPLCQNHIRGTEQALTLLPNSLAVLSPPATVKTGLMARISSGVQTAPAGLGEPAKLAGWVLGGLGLALVIFWAVLSSFPSTQPSRVAAISHDPVMTKILSGPETRQVDLKGLEADPGATAQFVWNPRVCRGCFIAKGLKKIPVDQVFELWAIKENTSPVPVGIFTVNEKGYVHVDFPALSKTGTYQKFAVTAEPKGGVLQPTGPMHLLGSL